MEKIDTATIIDLDAPAFPAKQEEESVPASESQPEKVDDTEQPTSGGEPVVEEQRVPYSRLKEAVERRREAERIADEAQTRLEEIERASRYQPRTEYQTPDATEPYKGSLPSYWVRMYGDNENSRYGYTAELERQSTVRDEIRREALDAVREERQSETQALVQNERTIDNRLEDLSYSLGRELTEEEESAILDIADEYTPKDENGNYAGDLMPFDKALEVYNLRQGQTSQRTTRSRRTPTALTGTPTQGEPSNKDADNKAWNPLDWNSYQRRIPKT